MAHRKLTNEDIRNIARKYSTRTQFHKADSSAYVTARRRTIVEQVDGKEREVNVLDWVCAHMKPSRQKHTVDSIKSLAVKYKTRSEFAKACPTQYSAASRMGIIDSVCAHMPKRKSKKDEK